MFPGFATALSGIQAGRAHSWCQVLTILRMPRLRILSVHEATLEESSAGGVIVSIEHKINRPGPQFTTGEDPFTLREGI